jgi:DNA-binding PadR family transcriptional regulator
MLSIHEVFKFWRLYAVQKAAEREGPEVDSDIDEDYGDLCPESSGDFYRLR